MKKLILSLALAFTVLLAGCNSAQAPMTSINPSSTPPYNLDLTQFTAFLGNEGFTNVRTQTDFLAQMKKYSYNGTTVDAYGAWYNYDGIYGGGCAMNSDNISFKNDYYQNDETGVTRSTDSLFTLVPLEGLTLPYGITFEDNVTSALAKLGIKDDPRLDFTADSGTTDTMTLAADGNTKLYYVDMTRTTAPIDYIAPFKLKFEQVYKAESSTITRTLELSYYNGLSNNVYKFYSAHICVEKSYDSP